MGIGETGFYLQEIEELKESNRSLVNSIKENQQVVAQKNEEITRLHSENLILKLIIEDIEEALKSSLRKHI